MLASFSQHYLDEVDALMRQVVNSQPNQPVDLDLMLRYALGWVDEQNQPNNKPTGKRIRPILLLLCAEAAGGRWESALPAAASVELLHNFSLVHDDIQDNSPLRHNRPTVWKIWGRANAINAGDALFTMAYSALQSLSTGIAPETVVKVWRIFNDTALELTRGQHLDMRYEHQSTVTVDEYLSMIRGKSAALIASCAQIGALIASNDVEKSNRYYDFGINIGMAFQIRDDILGIWGDPTVTGKSVATDILSKKKSLPVLYGLSRSDELNVIYQRESFEQRDVSEAVNILNALDVKSYSEQREMEFYRHASKALEQANPERHNTEPLRQLVDILLQRQY